MSSIVFVTFRVVRARLATAVLLACTLGSSGCSWIFTKDGPPHRCSTSPVPPVADTALAITQLTLTLTLPRGTGDADVVGDRVGLLLGLGFSAMFVASAVYGATTISDCKSSRESMDRALDAARAAPKRQGSLMPPARRVVRERFELEGWQLELVGVPEVEPDTAALRIETRADASALQGCERLAIEADGTTSMHPARGRSSASSGGVRETVAARVTVGTLSALGQSIAGKLDLCAQSRAMSPDALAAVREFTAAHAAARRAMDPANARPVPVELHETLVLGGIPVRVLAQPAQHAGHLFLLLPGANPEARSCTELIISVDGAPTRMKLGRRPGDDDTPYAAIELALAKRIVAATEATLDLCGELRRLGSNHRKRIGSLIDRLERARPAP